MFPDLDPEKDVLNHRGKMSDFFHLVDTPLLSVQTATVNGHFSRFKLKRNSPTPSRADLFYSRSATSRSIVDRVFFRTLNWIGQSTSYRRTNLTKNLSRKIKSCGTENLFFFLFFFSFLSCAPVASAKVTKNDKNGATALSGRERISLDDVETLAAYPTF